MSTSARPPSARPGPGPWTIAPHVAWVDLDHLLILDLRAPYDSTPWIIDGMAAVIWEAIVLGRDRDQIVREDFAEILDPRMPAEVDAFLEELTRTSLIVPVATTRPVASAATS